MYTGEETLFNIFLSKKSKKYKLKDILAEYLYLENRTILLIELIFNT